MNKSENRTKCGYVEFTFNNEFWFNSRINVITAVGLTLSSFIIASSELISGLISNLVAVVFISLLSLFILLRTLFAVVKETLYVITPIGVQFTSTNLIGKESVFFIPWHSVKNFVIVEVIVGQQIFFYLAIQTMKNKKEGLVVLFKDTKPRLLNLEKMYKVIVGLLDCKHYF